MEKAIIDCCSLLNLYMGWQGLGPLQTLPYKWHICRAVLGESEYVREFREDGSIEERPLDLNAFVREAIMTEVSPQTEAEQADYVNFAVEMDDGEAQALSIAKHRAFTLLTDDRKALSVAARNDVGVVTMSTTQALQVWVDSMRVDEAAITEVLRRITRLARYVPRNASVDQQWWSQFT